MTGRALITGASGFLGRHLIEELRHRGVTTVALVRRSSGRASADQQVMVSDETNATELTGILAQVAPDFIFHLAGRPTASMLTDLYRTNVLYAAALLEAARTLDVRPTIILAGSAAEYGPAAATLGLVGEDAPCQPTAPYGITKLAQTLHGLAEHDRVVVARLFNLVGPGMPEHLALGSFASRIKRMGAEGGTMVTGLLSVERDFVEVAGAANALIALAHSAPPAPVVVNVCTGIGTNLRSLVMGLIAASGKAITVEERDDLGSTTSKGITRFVGDSTRLGSWGLSLLPPDPEQLGYALVAPRK